MIQPKVKYQFKGELWRHQASWYFVSLPKDISKEIRSLFKNQEEGWGRLKMQAQIKSTLWDTAIWFDTKRETYLLPIKADIRKKTKSTEGQTLNIEIHI